MPPIRLALPLLLLAALPALADMAPEPVPAAEPAPRGGNQGVEMVAEEVTLLMTSKGLQVEAVFHMRNPGKEDVRLQVGFPAKSRPYADLEDFTVSREGKAFETTLTQEDAQEPWRLWEAVYPAGKTVTETVRYRTDWDFQPGYILHTGAGWAGRIGKAVVVLKVEEKMIDDLTALRPLGFVRDGGTFTWIFTDLEPTEADDIRIRLARKGRTLEVSRKSLEEEIGKSGEDPALLTSLAWQTLDAVNLGSAEPSEFSDVADRLLKAAMDQGRPKPGALGQDGIFHLAALLHERVRAPRDAWTLLPDLEALLSAWQDGNLKIHTSLSPDAHSWKGLNDADLAKLKADLKAARNLLENAAEPDPNGQPNGVGKSGPKPSGPSGLPQSGSGLR